MVDSPDESNWCSAEEFEAMIASLRHTFITWLRRTDRGLQQSKLEIETKRKELEEETAKQVANLAHTRASDLAKLKEDRRRLDLEMQHSIQQIQVEREDMRKKMKEEKSKFEKERVQRLREYNIEREKFRQEYERFIEEKERIADHAAATELMIDINVGGVVFETSRATLCQQPNSYLKAMVSGKYNVQRDRNGRIFIDRDAETFRSILNFLREPLVPPLPRDFVESETLCKDAAYYGIHFYPYPLIYSLGGHNSFEHLSSMEVLDVTNQCWRNCKPMSTERTYCGGTVLDGKVMVFGGQNTEYKALCDMEVYDCLRDEWYGGAPLTVPRRNCAAAVSNSRLFAIGGFDGQNILSQIEAYDPRMKNWMLLAPMIEARSSPMVAINPLSQVTELIVAGGTSETGRLKSVESFDERMNRWIPYSTNMIEMRSAGASVQCLGSIYVIGGSNAENEALMSVEALDLESSVWRFQRSLNEARMDCSAVTITDSIMVTGGQNGQALASTEFYKPEIDEWQRGPDMLQSRFGHVTLFNHL